MIELEEELVRMRDALSKMSLSKSVLQSELDKTVMDVNRHPKLFT